jgi:hypothetical protein
MVYLQTKNPNLGKFWILLQRKMLVYFGQFGQLSRHLKSFTSILVYFVVIWYIFPVFGMV